ncbi:MAG: ABC transporter substrate-binding protein [Limnochordia bacterium]|jgi:peptide/nickel transport system substrate-binding protein|nr:ABC transporter substrate-binding protein [Bacillota bacterium]NLO96242.1 ABC transporter substrate-binding protein [Bacillota bacterium]
MRSKSVLLLLVVGFCLVFSSVLLAAEPPRHETLIADILTGKVGNPGNFNFWATWVGNDKGLQQLVIDPLWMADYVTGEMINVLAKENPIYSEDFTTMTVKLREGIYWNDGVPFTADDVVYTVELSMATPGFGYHTQFNQYVEKVYKTDDYTVIFELKQPNSRFHYQFLDRWGACRILPKHVFEQVEDPLSFQFNPPVGTGPYKLVDYDLGGYWFLYELREDWERTATGMLYGKPAPKYVKFMYVGDASKKAMAMINHELDMADLTPESLEVVLSRNEYASGYYKDFPWAELLHPCVTGAAFNTLVYPFDNPEVRWALNLALDAKNLALTAYNGAVAFAPAYIPALLPYYELYYERMLPYLEEYTLEIDGEEYKIFNSNLPFEMAEEARRRGYDVPETEEEIRIMFGYGWWKHSPELAEKLLLKNGFTRGRDGKWLLPDGTPWKIEIVCLTAATNPSFKWAFAIANQWSAFGIDCEAIPTEVVESLTETGDYQVVGGQPAAEPFGAGIDLYRGLNVFHSQYWKPIGEKLVGHQSRWVNEEIDYFIDQMEQTDYSDPKNIELAIEVAKRLIDGQPGVSLASFPGFMGLDNYYWTNYPTGDNPYAVPWYHWPNFKFVLPFLQPTGRH